MLKAVAALLLIVIGMQPAGAAVLSNDKFCRQGISLLADSLVQKLRVTSDSGVTLLPVDGHFGEHLRGDLSRQFARSGIATYLSEVGSNINRPVVKTVVDDYHLSYRGVGRGFLRQPAVERIFVVGAVGSLMGADGKLWRSAEVVGLAVGDTLKYSDARAARGKDSFLAPPLPATVYQRLVEPGLILGITGALVYLFFASR